MNDDRRKYMPGTEEYYAHQMSFCIHRVAMMDTTVCKAGVIYMDTADPEVKGLERLPCFNPNLKTCHKAEYPSREDIDRRIVEQKASLERMGIIRTAILAYLEEHGQKTRNGRTFGSGRIQCPACKTGTVGFSRSSYNGHVHAACSTEGCAAWME